MAKGHTDGRLTMADKIKIITTQMYEQTLTKAQVEEIIAEKELELTLWKSRLQDLKVYSGEIFTKNE